MQYSKTTAQTSRQSAPMPVQTAASSVNIHYVLSAQQLIIRHTKVTRPQSMMVGAVLDAHQFVQLANHLQVLRDTLQYHLKEEPHVLHRMQGGQGGSSECTR